ncbi:MAG: hypothetical protein FJY65_02400 [Calditrichaeota bacterium]|nr:hypothetical protein [Calditrichota bacterium]
MRLVRKVIVHRQSLGRVALGAVLFALFNIINITSALAALDAKKPSPGKRAGPARIDIAQVNAYNRVHRRSNIWMNVTNWGFFGNYSRLDPSRLDDPCTGEYAPQCEYPGGSRVEYLFMGSLWLGALIRAEGYEYPRVSVGMDGWMSTHEFWPGEGELHSLTNGIKERTTLPIEFDCLGNYIGSFRDSAVSEQDFVSSYADTLTERYFVDDDPIDGPHIPLGIKITQKSYAWTYNYAQNFIIIDWEIENIAGNYLKNLYIGLYIDADVGGPPEQTWHEDDICGFQQYYYYERPDGGLDSAVINTAWIADNDGRPKSVASGNEFSCPAVTGTRVLRAPNPKLKTCFNWWVSHGQAELDFGPAWEDDGAPGAWTKDFGTPMGDTRKYFVLKNREFDYDQLFVNQPEWIRANPQKFYDRWNPGVVLEQHAWKIPGETDNTPQNLLNDIANGYDTRYLISWGPLGIFDHIEEQTGERIYRLNPGEKFSMTIAYVAGDNFHDRNNPQPDNEYIDFNLFNFASLRYNADWAAKVYDNPMVDTDGDGWYGEDTGNDGLYALARGDTAYRWEGGVRQAYIYPGPDPDGSENNSRLEPAEDALERPEHLDYTRLNEMLDFGDGVPDFRGPPPPHAPILKQLTQPCVIPTAPGQSISFDANFLAHNVVLTWKQCPSEDPNYKDPFSREWDFEGYRVYVSNTMLEKDFAFMDEFDRVDFSLYGPRDSLAWMPVGNEAALPRDTTITGIPLTRKPVGKNIGMFGHSNLVVDTLSDPNDWSYYYIVRNAHPMVPRYYSVTSYDYGDYKTGTQPLESARIANAIFIAPSGREAAGVMVVPNPYRVAQDYRQLHGGVSWENRDDGTVEFFPQTDRRMYFYNLPRKCLIRIYTVAGDLVDIVPHNIAGDDQRVGWNAEFAEPWDLNSRNSQQVVSGMYLFTVEDLTDENKGKIETGKFVVIR